MTDHLKTIREALRLAIDVQPNECFEALAAIDALEAAMREPVAYTREGWGTDCGPYVEFYRADEFGSWRDKKEWTPLFAAPPAQQPKEPTRQSEWANVPKAFNDWWNDDYDDSTNPFRVNSAAYWAWAGWSAAQQAQPSDEAIKKAWTDTTLEPCTHEEAFRRGALWAVQQAQAEAVPQDVLKDAQRYRWLRAKKNTNNEAWNHFGPYSSPSEIDATIDAAIAAAPQPKEQSK